MLNEGVIGDGEERVTSVEDRRRLGEGMAELAEKPPVVIGRDELVEREVIGRLALGVEVVLKVANMGERPVRPP